MQTLSNSFRCSFSYDYKLRLSDAGTKLIVIETPQGYEGPEPTEDWASASDRGARAIYKEADRLCRVEVPMIVGKRNEIVLERVSASVP
jgi:hypothetical protein